MSSAAAESSRSTWSGKSPGLNAAAVVPSFAVMLEKMRANLMVGDGWVGFDVELPSVTFYLRCWWRDENERHGGRWMGKF